MFTSSQRLVQFLFFFGTKDDWLVMVCQRGVLTFLHSKIKDIFLYGRSATHLLLLLCLSSGASLIFSDEKFMFLRVSIASSLSYFVFANDLLASKSW